jgi:MFS family permease
VTAPDHSYESPKDRASLAREAGLGRLSFPSILAGVLVAYGAFAVLAALVGTVAAAVGLNTDRGRNDWATLGVGSAVAVAVVLLVAYLFGGYVAGRMARRAGLLNGLAVFLLAVALVGVVGAVAASQADAEAIARIASNLRSLGIPTTGTEWGKAGTVAGIGSLAAMLVGALLGGVLGERWHSKLTRRAVSGKYRPGRDHQPPDHDRPGHDQTLDQRDRPTPDHKDDTGATRLTSPATQAATAERTSRSRHDR